VIRVQLILIAAEQELIEVLTTDRIAVEKV
jgi:hypothetical protein